MQKLQIPGYTGAILIPKRPNFWQRLFGFKVSPLTEELLVTVAHGRKFVSQDVRDRIIHAFLSDT